MHQVSINSSFLCFLFWLFRLESWRSKPRRSWAWIVGADWWPMASWELVQVNKPGARKEFEPEIKYISQTTVRWWTYGTTVMDLWPVQPRMSDSRKEQKLSWDLLGSFKGQDGSGWQHSRNDIGQVLVKLLSDTLAASGTLCKT